MQYWSSYIRLLNNRQKFRTLLRISNCKMQMRGEKITYQSYTLCRPSLYPEKKPGDLFFSHHRLCHFCGVTPVYFLLKNWRPFLLITVTFLFHSGVTTDLHILDDVPPVYVMWNHVDADKLLPPQMAERSRRAQPVSVTNITLKHVSHWSSVL